MEYLVLKGREKVRSTDQGDWGTPQNFKKEKGVNSLALTFPDLFELLRLASQLRCLPDEKMGVCPIKIRRYFYDNR